MSKNALPPSLVGCYHKDKRHINSALGAIVMSVLPAKADLLPLGPIARACGPRGCSRGPAPASQDRRQHDFHQALRKRAPLLMRSAAPLRTSALTAKEKQK